MANYKAKMRERIIIVLARNRNTTVSGSFLRKQVEYYIKKLKWSELDFLNFLDKLEDSQEILKSVKNMKVHYELFNTALGLNILSQARQKQASTEITKLQELVPDLIRHAALLKQQRQEIPTISPVLDTPIPTKYEPQKEVLSNDPEGFGVKTRRTL